MAAALAPDAQGRLVLGADDAEMHGGRIKAETKGRQSNIGFWDNGQEWASWKAQFPKAGTFKVSASISSTAGASEFVVEIGRPEAGGARRPRPQNYEQYKNVDLGKVEVKAGTLDVNVKPQDAAKWKAMNLRSITIAPAE